MSIERLWGVFVLDILLSIEQTATKVIVEEGNAIRSGR